MRWAAVLTGLFLMVPAAQAGTREDPEVKDAANDTTRYPGVPTVEPTVDILGIWFTDEGDELTVSMEVAQIASGTTEVPNVSSRESYAANVFVDGEDEGDPGCSGWGDFGVRWDSGSTADLEYGWRSDGDGCPSEREPANFTVADNVITWRVPKASLAMLRDGSVLTLARAQAWSGDTWPATPDDRADALPGRPFMVVSSGKAAEPTEDNATRSASPTAAASATQAGGGPPSLGGASESAASQQSPAASSALALLAVAGLAWGVRRQSSR